ncbi:MAG: FtsW/RodA/SpoVE family cell cycle protein [Paludibacteraceae bacterium]|nr:FtsW/RodA/SpoVE family cell cycle protein [Paludibacteraceae bacterium]
MKLPVKYVDRPFWMMYFALLIVAMIALFSASSAEIFKHGSIFHTIGKQVFFWILGLGFVAVLQYIPSRLLRKSGFIFWVISMILLYSLLIPHNPFAETHGEATRWFNLRPIGIPLTFQPSELAKFSLVLLVADYLSRIETEEDGKKYFFLTLGITAVTILPILPNNLSTCILICGVVFIMWFLARVPWKYLLGIVSIVLAILLSGYFYVEYAYIKPHVEISSTHPLKRAVTWVGRVDAFLEQTDETDEEFEANMKDKDHYQRSLSNTAIVLGGKTPFGVFPGNSQERDFLPIAYADYIFAIMVEETGIVGAVFILFIYLAILFRACYISSRYTDYGSMLMMMGMALMITCQALVSMAVAVGIGPVTGQPLPLISAGGTSAVITSLYFGFMFAVAREQKALTDRQAQVQKSNINDIPEFNLEV